MRTKVRFLAQTMAMLLLVADVSSTLSPSGRTYRRERRGTNAFNFSAPSAYFCGKWFFVSPAVILRMGTF